MADQVPRMFALQHQFAHGTLPLSKGRLLTSDNLEHLFPQASRKPRARGRASPSGNSIWRSSSMCRTPIGITAE